MLQPGAPRLFGLDLLRATAIGLVLFCHLTLVFVPPLVPGWLAEVSFFGDLGVDLFFVLSGFLIGGILLRDLERGASFRELMHFWSRRWWRTLPNYYLFLALNMAASWFLGHAPGAPRYLAFMQGLWWDPDPGLFHESWSLCVEEWFYLSFAFLAFTGAAVLPGHRSYLVAASTVATVSFLLRAFLVLFTQSSIDAVRYSTLPRLDSLMFGVVAAYLMARWPAHWKRAMRPAAVAGLSLLTAGIALRAGLSESNAITRLVYFDVIAMGTAMLLPWLSARRAGAGKATGFVTRVSLYSYSMYLVNVPLARLLVRKVLVPDSLVAAALLTAMWLAGTYVLSELCYRLYESRMTRLRDLGLLGSLHRVGLPRLLGIGGGRAAIPVEVDGRVERA
jgi:peptidoglycan/LPS O-acetylase OafA/YrhL